MTDIGRASGVAIICTIWIIYSLREVYHLIHYTTPQQLVQLVIQAHAGGPFKTKWNIQVSQDMRDALRLPLTPEQLAMMRAAGADILSSSASCYLLSHKQSDRQITGVARVSVQLRSKYSKTVRNLPEAELRITIRSNGSVGLDVRWAIESVEQIA